MIEVKDLTGADLALWAARADGADAHISINGRCFVWEDGAPAYWFKPHEDWYQGGALIFKHKIATAEGANQTTFPGWHAKVGRVAAYDTDEGRQFGPTPLIAAMRALVWSVYGDTVPDEVAP